MINSNKIASIWEKLLEMNAICCQDEKILVLSQMKQK